jgi:hypothetical protein
LQILEDDSGLLEHGCMTAIRFKKADKMQDQLLSFNPDRLSNIGTRFFQ